MRKIVEYRIQYAEKGPKKKRPVRKASPLLRAVYGIFGEVAACFVLVAIVFTFVGRTVIVDGDSMNPTLNDLDRLLTVEMVYTPAYGDIVIISRLRTEEEPLVKRVIALPGDEVFIDFTAHEIRVNGQAIADYGDFDAISHAGDVRFPLTVPPDCLFVLGDNRNNSKDSRYAEVGCVSTERVMGRAVLRIFPFDSFSTIQ